MRITAAVCLLLAAANFSFAEETRAPTPAGGDAISAAKRDLEAIKASRGIGGPRTDLPKMAIPEMHTAPTSEPRPWLSPKARASEKEKKKSANWLIEAMEKNSRPANDRSGKTEKRDHERLLLETEKDPTLSETETVAPEETPKFEEKERKPEPVVNPLTRYMADWMSPQDYALLKPGFEGPRSADLDMTRDSGSATAPIGSATAGLLADDPTLALIPASKPFAPPAPRENPYLQGLTAPLPASSPAAFSPPPAMMIAPAPAPRTMAPPPPAPPAAAAKVPDFAKPLNDEKYFKPLKRF